MKNGLITKYSFHKQQYLGLILITVIFPRLYCPLRVRLYKPITDFISTCPQTKLKVHPANLGLPCGQHVKFSRHCWFYRSGLQQDAGLAPILPAGIEPGTAEFEAVTLPQRSFN